MKKIVCVLLLVGICFSFAGCREKNDNYKEIIFTDNYLNDINELAKEVAITKIVVVYSSIGKYREWKEENPAHANGTFSTYINTFSWLVTYERVDFRSSRYSFSGNGTYIVANKHVPNGIIISNDLCYVEYSVYQIATYKSLGEGMIALQIFYQS